MAEQEMLTVEQCDRDAAVRLTQDIGARTRGERSAMLNGYADDDCYVQAFASHRLAVTKAADERVVELKERATFLLDRLAEIEWHDDGYEAVQRDYFGHVEPAIESLRDRLAATKAAMGEAAPSHYTADRRPKIGHKSGCVTINCAGCGADFFSVDYSAPAPAVPREDFLTRLRRTSAARVAAWANGEECDEMFHATELGGETGEILNVVKKLYRERRGWRGSRATVEELGEEIGDALICLDKLAAHYGIDLAAVTAKKFDATSEKVGLPHRLGVV